MKQPKLEPKLVWALSETEHLFRLGRFFTETANFGVLIEPKQKKDQPKLTHFWARKGEGGTHETEEFVRN